MAKQLEKTIDLIDQIKASTQNPDIDTSQFAVFEARMLSTEAISQKGFHDGARVSRSTLAEMETYVNTDGTMIPLQIMHDNQMLPVGRVISAKLVDMDNGETELLGKFYISGSTEFESDLIKKIEASVIDEVSVGLLANHAFCSECGFDYFGEDASFFNLMTLTCENDHTIGTNGTHVRLVGMDTFAELSLVNRGAAKDAKILSRAAKAVGGETVERLVASGTPFGAHLLTASYKLDSSKTSTKQGDSDMGLETKLAEVSTELGSAKAELSQANETIKTLGSEKGALEASIVEKDAEIAELKADEGEKTKELKASLEKAETQLTEATDAIQEDLKAALVASGQKEEDIPEDLVGMLNLAKESGKKLHQLFAGEPKSNGKKTDDKADETLSARRKSTFKVNG